jgi:hypothetical protein
MLKGGCLCGALRYETTAEPARQTACHCTICRRASGAPFVAWFSVPSASFRFVTGRPARFKSSEHGTRTFCAGCGTPLTFRSTRYPDEIDITTCSLDDPEAVPPRDHTFARSSLPWVRLADGLSAYPAARPDQGSG